MPEITRDEVAHLATLARIDLSEAEQEALLRAGAAGARRFLETWDFEDWLSTCR